MSVRFHSLLRAAILAVGVLLLLDLFLDWRRVTVDVTVAVEAGESGWNGWGALAGALLLVLLVVETLRPEGQLSRGRAADAVVLALAVGVLAAVAASFADEGVRIVVGPVTVEESGRQWPAAAGLVLASVQALLAVARLLPEAAPVHHARHGAA